MPLELNHGLVVLVLNKLELECIGGYRRITLMGGVYKIRNVVLDLVLKNQSRFVFKSCSMNNVSSTHWHGRREL